MGSSQFLDKTGLQTVLTELNTYIGKRTKIYSVDNTNKIYTFTTNSSTNTFYFDSKVSSLLDDKANIKDQTFTGTPKAPTTANKTDYSQIATITYLSDKVEDINSYLSGSMHFIGSITNADTSYSSLEDALSKLKITYTSGDVIAYSYVYTENGLPITTNKEYVYNNAEWTELGDESHALKTLKINVDKVITGGGRLDKQVTFTHVTKNNKFGDGTSYGALTTETTASSLLSAGKFVIPRLNIDSTGHITSAENITYQLPSSNNYAHPINFTQYSFTSKPLTYLSYITVNTNGHTSKTGINKLNIDDLIAGKVTASNASPIGSGVNHIYWNNETVDNQEEQGAKPVASTSSPSGSSSSSLTYLKNGEFTVYTYDSYAFSVGDASHSLWLSSGKITLGNAFEANATADKSITSYGYASDGTSNSSYISNAGGIYNAFIEAGFSF